MEILVDSRQMKLCDRNTIECFGVPSLVLMERAALSVADEIEGYFQGGDCLKGEKSVLVVCGLGNNGGDGAAAGRILWQKGYAVTIVMPPDLEKASLETKWQIDILRNYGIGILHEIPEGEFQVVVDALFGIGLARDLEGAYKGYVAAMNEKEGWKVAVDIPSGIHADTGMVMGAGFRADITVTFGFPKSGLVLYPGAAYAGKVSVKDIGIDKYSFMEEKPHMYLVGRGDLAEVPRRRQDSNKGTYGKVLVVAGHKNMAGAAFLSAKASYRTGAGLVQVLTEESNRVILQQLLPEAILAAYEGSDLPRLLKWASAITIGPGLGTGEREAFLTESVLKMANVPVILDADGLNILAGHLEWLREAKAPVIITPHLGEMARLVKMPIPELKGQLLQAARSFAREYNVICVLKDARTVTALPNKNVYINTTGNNGMATAGSGDVLTGILAGLIAQGMEPQQAAPIGVCLHGAAGDRQAQQIGPHSLMAQDIIEGIPGVLNSLFGFDTL